MRWPLAAAPLAVQDMAFNLGIQHERWGHFLEQGLGKSALCLADFLYYLAMGEVRVLVMVCPSYLISNWEDEVKKWGVDVPVYTWPQKPSPKDAVFIFVINTEAVINSGGKFLKEVLQSRRCMMAVDESSLMKNHQASITKALLELGKLSRIHRALSGTPMSQSVMDLWPQLRWCGALNGVNPYAFRNRFAVMGGYMGKQVKGVKNEDELHQILDSCSIRATKDQWLDLPDKIYPSPLEYEMTPKQKTAYKSMLAEFYAEVNGREITAPMVIHQQMKLQQIARGFILHEGVVEELVEPKDNPAINTVVKALENVRGKTLIFAFHGYSVRVLYERLKAEGFNPVALRGGLDKEDIARRKEAFNENASVRAMVLQTTVGYRGHTLLGQAGADRCSTTTFYENTYSLEVRTQAEDRNHRQGQDTGVVYLDLMCSKIDRKPIEAFQRKTNVVDAVIGAVKSINPNKITV